MELVWKGILYRTLKHLFYIIFCDFNFCGPGLTAEITSYTVFLKVKITRIPIDLQKIEQFSHLLWHSKSHTAPYNMWKIARPRPINIITISRSVTKNCWKKNQNKNNRYFFILLVLRSNSLFVKQQVDLFYTLLYLPNITPAIYIVMTWLLIKIHIVHVCLYRTTNTNRSLYFQNKIP